MFLIAALLLSGCAGSAAERNNPAPLAPAPPSADAIPFPDDHAASSLTQYLLLGKQTFQRSAGANDSGNAVQLSAPATASAFAVYRFKPLGAPDNVQVSLGETTTAAWIGMADFTRQRWSLSGPYTSSQVFNLTAGNCVSPNGTIYLAVIAPAGTSAVVDQLLLFAANIPPTAAFTATPQSGPVPLTVDFDATASADADGPIALYEWDFDNDGLYEEDNGATPALQHVFTTPGSYPVSLRVTDNGGDSDTHSATILVEHAPPIASFTVTADQQINPLKLNYIFDASASSDPEGGALTYDWDFNGDGNWDIIGGNAVENSSYPNIGVYPAKLRVTNPVPLSATATVTVYCPSVWSSFGGPPGCTTRQSLVVGAQANHVKWTFQTGGQITSSPAIGPDGTVYISSSVDGHLYALVDNGTDTPSVKWSFALSLGANAYSTPAIGADGTVYIGGPDGNTYALADNGTATPTVKWSYATGEIEGSPCVGPDGTVYVGSQSPQDTIYALVDNGSSTPTVKWSFTASQYFYGSPAIGPDGTLYIGNQNHKLYALVDNGTATPTVKWSFTASGSIQSRPALGPDGTVYVGSEDHKVYALVDTGTPTPTTKWSYTTAFGVYSSPGVGPDGTVYVGGSLDKSVYALVDNGTPTPTVKWSYTTSGKIDYSSPVIGLDGTVYIGSEGGFYAFADNGTGTPTVKWSYPGSFFASAGIGADGILYFGDNSGMVTAIGP